jgi:hypothetical protein
MISTPEFEAKIEQADRLTSYGLLVFALGATGYPHKLCDDCQDKTGDRAHMAECACISCHGFYRATDDLDVFADQLERKPNSILGVRTGLASRILVLDFDKHEGGDNGFEALGTWHAEDALPATPRVLTGGRGLHYYYRLTEDCPTKGGFRPGVDLKADGGYVVAPGFGKRGKPVYEETTAWASGFDDLPIAPAPRWVLAEAKGAGNVGVLRRARDPNAFDVLRLGADPVAAYRRHLDALRRHTATGGRNERMFVAIERAHDAIDAGRLDIDTARAEIKAAATECGLLRDRPTDFEPCWRKVAGRHTAPQPTRPPHLTRSDRAS